jgi:O-antigen/teichoic acid export membrane protein
MPNWIGHWLRDTRLLLGSQLIAVLTTAALAILLARALGPSDWGLFSVFLGLSLALSTFVDAGLGTWLLRGLSRLREDEPELARRHRESSRRILGAALANVAFGAILFIGVVIAVASLGVAIETAVALLGLLAYTVFLAASNCLEAFLRAERGLTTIVAAILVERCLLVALVGAALLLTSGIWAISLAYLVAGLARFLFVGVTIFSRHRVPVVVPTFHDIRRFLLSGVPFAFNTVALNVIPRFDPLVVALVSATAAGYFALADRIVALALIAPAVASTALYPFLAREAPSSRVAWKISAGMMVVGFGAAVAGAVLAPMLVPAVFGRTYEDAVPVVQLMLFAVPFFYASSPLLTHLYTSGNERKVLAATLVASVLGTSAILAGQVSLGASGAAAGYLSRTVLFALTLTAIALWHRPGSTGIETLDSPASRLMSDHPPRK